MVTSIEEPEYQSHSCRISDHCVDGTIDRFITHTTSRLTQRRDYPRRETTEDERTTNNASGIKVDRGWESIQHSRPVVGSVLVGPGIVGEE